MGLPEILEYIKTAGPEHLVTLIFAILWWLERGERQDTQGELKQVADKSTTAMIELKGLIGQLHTIFGSRNGSGK